MLSERDLHFAAGILDTAIVDRGRNVLSCSRDGTARLWDCGKSACLGVIADCGSPINGIAVGTADNSLNLGTPEKPPSKDLALKIPLRSPVPNCLGLSPIILSTWLAAVCPWEGRWDCQKRELQSQGGTEPCKSISDEDRSS